MFSTSDSFEKPSSPLCPLQTLPQMSFACFCHRFMLPQGGDKSFKNILHNQRRPFHRTMCISTEPRLTADCAIPSRKRERPLCTEAKVSTCLVCSLVRTKLSIFPSRLPHSTPTLKPISRSSPHSAPAPHTCSPD